jgi:5-methylthioadenosine/S-adenosylhomocysteine deaminase
MAGGTAPARSILTGRIVTMDHQGTVLPRGRLYLAGRTIVAVLPDRAPPPAGFADAPVIATRGTIYPGLIELHNHLPYNILPLWAVPRRYTNRTQWSGIPAYRAQISGPMQILGRTPGYIEAIVRYVEVKCLLGGVTTSQGIALYSNQGIARYYHGAVRNVEQPADPELPAAQTRIADVEAVDVARFHARLQRSACLLLHLSEGTDVAARRTFLALQLPDGAWALSSALAGIHALALAPADIAVVAAHGASVIWSPLSNLLLYGAVADVRTMHASGVRIALGSDWSPSGSKNLLGELKAARVVSDLAGGIFTDQELLAMATRNAAAILGWSHAVGSLEAGKRADLIVVAGQAGDPYAHLLTAPETALHLVLIDGEPHYGTARLVGQANAEPIRVGGRARVLAPHAADAVLGGPLTLRTARARLTEGMARLPELARALEQPTTRAAGAVEAEWSLLLDQEEPLDLVQRPYLIGGAAALDQARDAEAARAAAPLSEVVQAMTPDPLSVVDDRQFLARLAQQPNMPSAVVTALHALYGA